MTARDDSNTPGAELDSIGEGFLPGLLGIRFNAAEEKFVEAQLDIRKALMAPNGFLQAASIVALADTACGHGCIRTLPEGARGFTTVELKANFLGTAREGTIVVRAEPRNLGRTTQL